MVDVCVIVEGAYPYITGGVSSWLHALIKNLPDISFSILHVGTRPDPQRKILYELPANVVQFEEIFINDPAQNKKKQKTHKIDAAAWEHFYTLHESIAVGKAFDIEQFHPLFLQPGFAGLTEADILHSAKSWNQFIKIYEQYGPDQSFVDFFWTFRFTYLPIFRILEAKLPEAHLYHAVSTGFSGLLGALGKMRQGSPFFVTEHGIYTREREIEIAQSSWIAGLDYQTSLFRLDKQRLSFFQEWWLNIYRFMEKVTYNTADAVISITGVNQVYQQRNGAQPERMKLVPNGIDVEKFIHLRPQKRTVIRERSQSLRPHHLAKHGKETIALLEPVEHTQEANQQESFTVGFVGRIVPIKDVKTCIRAMKIANQVIPGLQVYMVGPTEEDLPYYRECQRLVELLQLEDIVHFTGPADVKEYYGKIDVMVLTSLSEGQPLVILESNAAGVPVVATNVGACGELLQGTTPADKALGQSGLITPVSSPQETANAIIQLWRDPDLREQMGRTGQARVHAFYRQEQLYQTYRTLYRNAIAQQEKQ